MAEFRAEDAAVRPSSVTRPPSSGTLRSARTSTRRLSTAKSSIVCIITTSAYLCQSPAGTTVYLWHFAPVLVIAAAFVPGSPRVRDRRFRRIGWPTAG